MGLIFQHFFQNGFLVLVVANLVNQLIIIIESMIIIMIQLCNKNDLRSKLRSLVFRGFTCRSQKSNLNYILSSFMLDLFKMRYFSHERSHQYDFHTINFTTSSSMILFKNIKTNLNENRRLSVIR